MGGGRGHIFNSNKLLVKCIIKVKLSMCISCHAAAEQKEVRSQNTKSKCYRRAIQWNSFPDQKKQVLLDSTGFTLLYFSTPFCSHKLIPSLYICGVMVFVLLPHTLLFKCTDLHSLNEGTTGSPFCYFCTPFCSHGPIPTP
jgi:hypothetical protein